MIWLVEIQDEETGEWQIALDKKGLCNPNKTKREALEENRHYWRHHKPINRFRVRKYVPYSDIAVARSGIEPKRSRALVKKGEGRKKV